MIHELRITLNYPATLEAACGTDVAQVPMPLNVEHQFLMGFLPRLDESSPQERERFMLHLGQQLFETLLPAGALEVYLRAMAEQRRMPGASLRIRIVSSNTLMLTQPWEFLYDTRQALFPATVPETPIVRSPLPVRHGSALVPAVDGPLRLLVVGACPEELPELDYRPELDAVAQVAEASGVQAHLLPRATYRALCTELERIRPHIVHVVCHGDVLEDQVVLWLEGRLGTSHQVDAPLLLKAFQAPGPMLVVLNACDTSKLNMKYRTANYPLQLLEGGIPAVVAMQHRIPDVSGVVFSPALYSALFQGKPLENALQDARHALLVSGGYNERHFSTPTLWLATEQGGQVVLGHQEDVQPVPREGTRRPFLYLNSFSAQDAALFFGRGKSIEALISQVATHRLLVLHGRSGIGKTSLLQAGLTQSSAGRFYLPVTLRFIAQPLQALADALQQALEHARSAALRTAAPRLPLLAPSDPDRAAAPEHRSSSALAVSAESLKHQLRDLQSASSKTVLLVLDQFEEFFVLLTSEEKRSFISALHALYLEAELRLRVVLIIRQEFFGELDKLRDLFPTILSSSFALLPLTQEGAREALIGPLDSLGVPYESALIGQLVQDLWADGVEPASLQIVGHHLYLYCYEQRGEPLSIQAYQELGGAGGILARYLETFLNPFSEEIQGQLLRVLSHFVTDQGTRQPSSAEEIVAAERLPGPVVLLRLDALSRAHLIRRIGSDALTLREEDPLLFRWELAHEVLIAAIQSSDLSAVKRQVRRLKRKIRLQVLMLNLGLALVLGILYGVHDRSLWTHVALLDAAGQSLTLERFPAQLECQLQAQEAGKRMAAADARFTDPREPLESRTTEQGSLSWLFQPEGTYSIRVRGAGHEIFFPLRFNALSWSTLEVRHARLTLPGLPAGIELVYIPAGEALLGDPIFSQITNTPGLETVNLPAYYISRFEITRGQFRAYVEAMRKSDPTFRSRPEGPVCYDTRGVLAGANWEDPRVVSNLPADALDRLPVVNVTFAEAEAFARWLSSLGPHRFRLPTQHEWEKAARGVDGRQYPWGTCFSLGTRANLGIQGTFKDPFDHLAPVGSFGVSGMSPYGAEDMSGNALELTSDCFTQIGEVDSYIPAQPGEACTGHAFRGGSWRSTRFEAMVTSAGYITATSCGETLGFRLVMEAD